MMNKKGISILKSILFILLTVTFIILLVYIFNYINDSNNKSESNESIHYVEPNSNYNIVSYVQSANLLFYKYNSYRSSTSNLNAIGNVLAYDNSNITTMSYNNNDIYSAPTIYNYDTNVLFITPSLASVMNFASSNNIPNTSNKWFNSFNSGTFSCVLAFNCSNIPINAFNFRLSLDYDSTSTIPSYLDFWVLTDTGVYKDIPFNLAGQNGTYDFNCRAALGNDLGTSNYIVRFGFSVYQRSSSTGLNYYVYNNNYTYNYTNFLNYYNNNASAYNDLRIIFNDYVYSSDYLEGFDSGYSSASSELQPVINELNERITLLNNQLTSLNTTISNQTQVIEFLQNQLNNASNRSFKTLFFNMADTPLRVVSNCLGFEVFGVNLFQFFIGVLTTLGCIWLIKKFI